VARPVTAALAVGTVVVTSARHATRVVCGGRASVRLGGWIPRVVLRARVDDGIGRIARVRLTACPRITRRTLARRKVLIVLRWLPNEARRLPTLTLQLAARRDLSHALAVLLGVFILVFELLDAVVHAVSAVGSTQLATLFEFSAHGGTQSARTIVVFTEADRALFTVVDFAATQPDERHRGHAKQTCSTYRHEASCWASVPAIASSVHALKICGGRLNESLRCGN
jgi:hypothetical protein